MRDDAEDLPRPAGRGPRDSGPAARPEEARDSTAAAITRSIDALFRGDEPAPVAMAEGHPFLARVRSYVAAEADEERSALGTAMRREAEALDTRGELDPLAAGIALLIVGASGDGTDTPARPRGGEEEAVRVARELTTPAVAARLVLHLGAERDEAARESWMQIAFHLPDVMAPALVDALADDRDRGARRAYLDAMKAVGEPGLRYAIQMLDDDRWFVVRNGVHLLADFGDEVAVGQLTATLAHSDPRVRRETVIALAKLGGEDASMLLLGLLADPDLEVREAATMAVGVLKVERALRPLLERLEEEESEDVLVQILRSLGQIGDPGAVPAIEKRAVGGFFSRPRAAVRIAAYRALAGIGTPHARELLEKAAEDRDPEVRTAVSGILTARDQSRGQAVAPGGDTGPVHGPDAGGGERKELGV